MNFYCRWNYESNDSHDSRVNHPSTSRPSTIRLAASRPQIAQLLTSRPPTARPSASRPQTARLLTHQPSTARPSSYIIRDGST